MIGSRLLTRRNEADRARLNDYLRDFSKSDKIEGTYKEKASGRSLAYRAQKEVSLMGDSSIIPRFDSDRQQKFEFDGFSITPILDENEEPLFIASEVCAPLHLTNVSQALSRLDDDEKREIILNDVTGRSQKIWCLTEPGLYTLLGSARKSVKFRRWIYHEVIPALAKRGAYSLQNLAPDELIVVLAQQNVDARKRLEAQQRAIVELAEKQADQAQQIEAVVERMDRAEYFTVQQWCQVQGLNVPDSVKQMWGKRASELSRARYVQIVSVKEGPYAVHSYHASILSEACVAKPKPSNQLPLPGSEQ